MGQDSALSGGSGGSVISEEILEADSVESSSESDEDHHMLTHPRIPDSLSLSEMIAAKVSLSEMIAAKVLHSQTRLH